MTDKTITEREAVLRERAAFLAGFKAIGMFATDLQEAASRYPLPKVTRPRVVRDPHGDGDYDYRVVNGELEVSVKGGHWRHDHFLSLTAERAKIWADLFANPTETVDDTD